MINKILLIAKLPPPIGGVTIHIQRFVKRLQAFDNIDLDILDYSRTKNIATIFNKIYRADIIHIHLSNKSIRFILVLILRVLQKKTIVTFHGKYNFENKYDRFVLKMASCSIVLNDYTLNNAMRYKEKNIKLIGAFIPPVEADIIPLDKNILIKIEECRTIYKNIYCANASNYVLDDKGDEIYMGTCLLNFFSNNSNNCLIFSDPTGNYKQYYSDNRILIPKNVIIIDMPHDFVNIIKLSNAFIRATTMDGDSLSVKEALYYGKPVYATDVVDRPEGVILFNDFEELSSKIESVKKSSYTNNVIDNTNEIVEVYEQLI